MLLCPACHNEPDLVADCHPCRGTGRATSVPLCVEPWNEVVPGLWMGGTDVRGGSLTAGVVKGPNRDRFDLLLPGADDLIVLRRDSSALRLVQTIDEEADRFAKHYHRGLRAKSAVKSTLDEIPGIGPKRKRALLKAFGSLDGIRAASLEQLAAVPGMNRKSAEELKGLL